MSEIHTIQFERWDLGHFGTIYSIKAEIRIIPVHQLKLVFLQVVAMAYDWTVPGRAEMVKSALDVLNVCAALPKAQVNKHFHLTYVQLKSSGLLNSEHPNYAEI